MIVIEFAQFKREQEAQRQRDFTIQEIAKGAGVSADTVSRLINEKVTRLDIGTIDKLCKFFGVEPGQPVPFIIFVGD